MPAFCSYKLIFQKEYKHKGRANNNFHEQFRPTGNCYNLLVTCEPSHRMLLFQVYNTRKLFFKT